MKSLRPPGSVATPLRKERVASQKTQERLREMVEILNKIEPRFGSDLIAYATRCLRPVSQSKRRATPTH